MTYHDQPIAPHTARHAASYLMQARIYLNNHGGSSADGLRRVAARIDRPCRAIGVARQALEAANGSIGAAVKILGAS